jgi:hypothetical protein
MFAPLKAGYRIGKAGLTGSMGAQTMAGAGIGAVAGAAGGYDINSAIEGAAKGAIFGGVAGAAFGGATRGIAAAPDKLLNAKGFQKAYQLKQPPVFGPKTLQQHMYGPKTLADTQAASYMHQAKISPLASMGRGAFGAGQAAASGAARAGAFGLDHFGAIAGVAAAGATGAAILGGVGKHQGSIQSMSSPTLDGAKMNADYNQQAIAAGELGQIGGGQVGTASQMAGNFEYATWMQTVGSMASNTTGGRLAASAGGVVQGLHAGRHG